MNGFGRLISKSNVKLRKGEKLNYLSYGLSLAPFTTSGRNVCPNATEGCIAGCVYHSGNGFYPSVQRARIARTKYWFEHKDEFKVLLVKELNLAVKLAKRKGMKLAIRLNVFSDIPWESLFPELFRLFPDIRFYDYTKNPRRMRNFILKVPAFPKNYYLTFSLSEKNNDESERIGLIGGNIAIPFYLKKGQKLPKFYRLGVKEYQVINGDNSDLRFRDIKNVVVGLKAKGKGRSDTTGFVVRI